MGVLLESTVTELLATAVVVTCTLLYYYFKTRYNYWRQRGVPFVPPSIPFGNFKDLILVRLSQAEVFSKLYQEAEGLPYVGLYQIQKPWLLVRDPQLIRNILVKDFAHFHDRGISFDEEREPLSQHLLNLEGTRWRELRAKLTPTFTSGKMKMMFSLIAECAQELGKFLESPARHGESLEMREVMAKFTTDVIGSCAFGLQFNSMKDPDSEFRAMGRKVFQSTAWKVVKRTMRSLAPSLLRLLRLKVMEEDVERFFINAVKDTIKYREENGITRNDFLQLLIQLKNKGKVQDDEVDSAEESKKHIPNGVQKEDHIETLRKYPPGSNLVRIVTKPYSLPGTSVQLEKGRHVVISVYGLHHDPKYFPNPEQFNPENFSDEAKAQRPHYVYLPFGEGPRNCIGLRFGLLQVKVGLTILLSKFQFDVCDKTSIPLQLDPKQFIPTPIGGIWLKLKQVEE